MGRHRAGTKRPPESPRVTDHRERGEFGDELRLQSHRHLGENPVVAALQDFTAAIRLCGATQEPVRREVVLQSNEGAARRAGCRWRQDADARPQRQRGGDAGRTRGVGREAGIVDVGRPEPVVALEATHPIPEPAGLCLEVPGLGYALAQQFQRAHEPEQMPGDSTGPVAKAALTIVHATQPQRAFMPQPRLPDPQLIERERRQRGGVPGDRQRRQRKRHRVAAFRR